MRFSSRFVPFALTFLGGVLSVVIASSVARSLASVPEPKAATPTVKLKPQYAAPPLESMVANDVARASANNPGSNALSNDAILGTSASTRVIVKPDNPENAEARSKAETRRQEEDAITQRRLLEDKKRAIDRQLEDQQAQEKRRQDDVALDAQRQAEDNSRRDAREAEDRQQAENDKREADSRLAQN